MDEKLKRKGEFLFRVASLSTRDRKTDLPMVAKQNETTTNKRTIIFAIIVGFALRTLALFDEEAHLFDVKLCEEEAKTLDDVLKVNIYSNNNSR